MNVIEIDAASNNGVDNIREIREEVAYSPAEGKYKVYIIDEVHMLSIGAFNALLKTLEEPPSYVIFILATTEAHKIPITILSRCQRYDFRRITIEAISERLASISITFMELPAAMALQEAHWPQGLPPAGFSQLTALAKILAMVVLPVPLVPQNR